MQLNKYNYPFPRVYYYHFATVPTPVPVVNPSTPNTTHKKKLKKTKNTLTTNSMLNLMSNKYNKKDKFLNQGLVVLPFVKYISVLKVIPESFSFLEAHRRCKSRIVWLFLTLGQIIKLHIKEKQTLILCKTLR